MALISFDDDWFSCRNGVLERITTKALTKVAPDTTLHPLLEVAHFYGDLDLRDVPTAELEQLLDAVHESLREWLASPPSGPPTRLRPDGDVSTYADPMYKAIGLLLNELSDKLARYIIRRKIDADSHDTPPPASQP